MEERIYTLQEAAERLHMPYRTLRDGVHAGKWPHRYISPRRRLMTEGDIADVLEMTARPAISQVAPSEDEVREQRAKIRAFLGAS